MMDWLYGELDPDQARDVSRHLDDCSRCHAELSALERTRELFREVPAEEPPAALSAMLIREAASRAPAAAKEPSRESGGGGFGGWLSGLFRPLMHPAAAALATLVLVAGVAGTLYLKQGEEHFAESETASTPASSERAAAPPAEPTAGAAADEGVGNGRELALEQEEPARQADILETERQSELRKERPEQQRKADVKPRLDRKKGKRRSPPPPPESVVANAISGGEIAADSAGGFAEGDSDRAQQRSYRSYREKPGAGLDAWAQNKQVELTRAYKDEDCLRAAKIANDILDRHPEFFSEETRNLEAVKRCRPYVTKERTRRSVARAKRSGSGGGNKAGKAAEKAAPMRDEALAEPAESK